MDAEVERLARKSAEDARAISLGGGLPAPETFPRAELTRAFSRLMEDELAEALQYGWPEGRERLRAFVAERLAGRGADVSAEDVIITSGAQQAITLAAQSIAARGARVHVAPATYPAALDLFRAHGLVPVTGDVPADLAYTMPAMGNPSGRALGASERAALLDRDVPLIEDDAYADIYFGAKPPGPLLANARDRVFHVGSFSKSLSPGLRVGYLVPPRRMREQVRAIKHAHDLQANSLSQALVEAYLRTGAFEGHLHGVRALYARRARVLTEAIRQHLPSFTFEDPHGAFSVWVDTGVVLDENALLASAVALGTSFDPGRAFCVEPTRTTRLRLSFASAQEHEIDEGVRRLARALRAHVSIPDTAHPSSTS